MKYINIAAIQLAWISDLRPVRLGLLILSIYAFFLTSCKRDLVSGESNQENDFMIVLPKEESTILRGDIAADSIIAKIKMPGEAETYFDTTNYSFIWTNFQNKDTIGTKPFLTPADFDGLEPKLISCLLQVTEKSTGVVRYATADVFVTTATREGWVLLGDQGGNARFSMLTYTANGYKKYIDLSAELGIDISLQGKPVSMNAVGTEQIFEMGKYQWLGVATDQEIKLIQTMDFKADQAMSDYVTSVMQPNATSPVTLEVNGLTNFVATKGNDVYYFSTQNMYNYHRNEYSMLNAYTPPVSAASPRFKASPYHTFTSAKGLRDYSRIMYAEDSGVFVRAHMSYPANINGVLPLQLSFSAKGFTLKKITTLKGPEVDEITALLYNPVTFKTYLIQFLSNGIVTYERSIPFTDAEDLMASEFIEIELEAGYLIYKKGHEVIAYDYKLGQTFRLLDLGNETISLIKIIHHYPPSSLLAGRVDLYKSILKRLIVCTYDESDPDHSGRFRSYFVQLGHQAPIVDLDETGFPKIVDITFAPIL